jgi:hypothetical protein
VAKLARRNFLFFFFLTCLKTNWAHLLQCRRRLCHRFTPSLHSQSERSLSLCGTVRLLVLCFLQLLVALHAANILLKIWPWDLNGLGHPAVGDPAEAANWPQDSRVDEVAVLVEGILADPEARALEHHHGARDLARRGTALKLTQALDTALDTEDGLGDARGAHVAAVVHRRQAAHDPLVDAGGRVDARDVGGLEEVLRDDVDDALARLGEQAQRVLGTSEAGGDAEHKQRRVVVDHVEVREGREVVGGAVGGPRRHEAQGPRHDAADEQLVVEGRGPPGLVRVNDDVRPGGVGGRAQRVGALARLPARRDRLRQPEPRRPIPGWPRRLDRLEVPVRVALDLGLGGRRHGHGLAGARARAAAATPPGGA